MAKKSGNRAVVRANGKRSAPMTVSMKLFAAGCFAELYVLCLRRFYINGTMNQVVAWYDALPWAGCAGLCVLLAGGVWCWTQWKNVPWRLNALCVAAVGGFAAAASFLAHWNQTTVNLFSVLVPAAMLLCVFWGLYDRACALSLTLLGVSLIAAWLSYRTAYQFSPYRVPVKVIITAYLAGLGALASLLRTGKGAVPRFLNRADPTPVYLACGLSAAGLLAALLGAAAAYYAMWTLALAAFGLVVYYTVRQM